MQSRQSRSFTSFPALRRPRIVWKLSLCLLIAILLSLSAAYYIDHRATAFLISAVYSAGTVFVVACVISLLAASFFAYCCIVPPTRLLMESMNKLADGEFDFRLKVEDEKDFGRVAASFNRMASMLASYRESLERSRDYLQGIVESTADIIITVSPEGKILTFNAGAERALGYRREEIIGVPIERLFVEPQERTVAIDRLERSDVLANYETRFRSKDGMVLNVLLTISRLRDRAGAVVGTIGISKDITNEKRLQEQLLQSQRYALIGQVFTGIQHSMKNMLNACKGGAYMVRLGLQKDDRDLLVEGWKIVQTGISSLTEMSMHMLRFMKDWKPKLEPVDIARILREIDRVVKQNAGDRGVGFRVAVPDNLPVIQCDAGMIQSAVMDIVSNALDACQSKEYGTSESPDVFLTAYSECDQMIIEVKDNGCGMTAEVKENIFTPFFSTKSRAGTGLGLSITFRMIAAHNGGFDVQSKPNRGTSFRIKLPLPEAGGSKEVENGQESADHR